MDYKLDDPAWPRLGMVVLSTDETLEGEARQVLEGQDARLYHSRIYSAPKVTRDSLKAMEALIPASAELLPEGLDAIAYGCTSASVMMGPDAVERQIHKVQPGVPVTNPIIAVLAALEHLGASRIALVTPYAKPVAQPMREFLERAGVQSVAEACFDEEMDTRVARISESSTLNAILETGRKPGVEAVFASCTNLRAFGIIEQAEAELGVPVISSNLALVWHLLRKAGVDATGWGPGRIFT